MIKMKHKIADFMQTPKDKQNMFKIFSHDS